MVRAAPSERFGWLTERTGYVPGGDFRAIESVSSDGRTLGLVGFDRWTPTSAQMHVALDAPTACAGLLRASFGYLFHEAQRSLALATVRGSNAASLRLCRKVGFRETHRTAGGWVAGEDLVHFELRRDSCRWLRSST